MRSPYSEKQLNAGLEALRAGETVVALRHFEKAARVENDPECSSYLAYCIARERGQVKKGIELCRDSIDRDTENPAHYLNLGRIEFMAGNKDGAIEAYRQGMRQKPSPEIVVELENLGIRRPPVFSFLKRQNPLNRYLGWIFARIGLR